VDIEIQYKIVGAGWSECVLDVYGQTCTVTASYLSDALGEFVKAVNHILGGGNEARFSFDEEPGEYRWILKRNEDNALLITIIEFPDLWGDKDDSEGKVIFEATCQAHEFGKALLVSLNGLLDDYGIVGYKEKWVDAEYPVEQYNELCSHVGISPSIKVLQPTSKSGG
jgi:hypothetical protein